MIFWSFWPMWLSRNRLGFKLTLIFSSRRCSTTSRSNLFFQISLWSNWSNDFWLHLERTNFRLYLTFFFKREATSLTLFVLWAKLSRWMISSSVGVHWEVFCLERISFRQDCSLWESLYHRQEEASSELDKRALLKSVFEIYTARGQLSMIPL